MALERIDTGGPIALAIVMYIVQTGVVLLVLFHDFATKDAVIIVSLLIIMYGTNSAQAAFESIISGKQFVALASRIARHTETTDQQGDSDVAREEITKKGTPYALDHILFGLLIALAGPVKE